MLRPPATPDENAPAPKAADELARQIASEVAAAGWPVGQSLGSEAALIERYRVGRGVLREAIRILERDAVVTMRKGPSGGLVVTEPSVDAVTYAARIHLSHRGLGPSDVLSTRIALELAAIDRVIDILDEDGCRAIQEQIELEKAIDSDTSAKELQRFHRLIAHLTRDAAMELFIDIMLRLTEDRWAQDRLNADRAALIRAIPRAHRAIATALLEGDRGRARRSMEMHLGAFGAWLETSSGDRIIAAVQT